MNIHYFLVTLSGTVSTEATLLLLHSACWGLSSPLKKTGKYSTSYSLLTLTWITKKPNWCLEPHKDIHKLPFGVSDHTPSGIKIYPLGRVKGQEPTSSQYYSYHCVCFLQEPMPWKIKTTSKQDKNQKKIFFLLLTPKIPDKINKDDVATHENTVSSWGQGRVEC